MSSLSRVFSSSLHPLAVLLERCEGTVKTVRGSITQTRHVSKDIGEGAEGSTFCSPNPRVDHSLPCPQFNPRHDLGRLGPGDHKQHRGRQVRPFGSDGTLLAPVGNKISEPITYFSDERCASNPPRTHILICDCGEIENPHCACHNEVGSSLHKRQPARGESR